MCITTGDSPEYNYFISHLYLFINLSLISSANSASAGANDKKISKSDPSINKLRSSSERDLSLIMTSIPSSPIASFLLKSPSKKDIKEKRAIKRSKKKEL